MIPITIRQIKFYVEYDKVSLLLGLQYSYVRALCTEEFPIHYHCTYVLLLPKIIAVFNKDCIQRQRLFSIMGWSPSMVGNYFA